VVGQALSKLKAHGVTMARTYKRDANGRFSGSGGGGKGAKGGKSAKAATGGPPPPPPGLSKSQWAKVNSSAGKPSNKVSSSPRRLSKAESIAASVMGDKRFRSDRQRINEMVKRGVSPKTDFVALVGNVRSKRGKKGPGEMNWRSKR
jgi:hypothetical protein